jgi:hypothetical protein
MARKTDTFFYLSQFHGRVREHGAVVVRHVHDGEYFPFTTFRRLIAHTRLTFIFLQSGRELLQRHRVAQRNEFCTE